MKQQINLYQVVKKAPDHRFNSKQVALALMAYGAILFVVTTVDLYSSLKQKFDSKKLATLKNEKETMLHEVLAKVEAQKENEKVLLELKHYEEKNGDKQAFVDSLSDFSDEHKIYYSHYFESLARKNVVGLWVKKISIQGGGSYLFLSGSCLKANAIPEFIASLKTEPAFSGKVFDLFNMTLDEQSGKINFNMETKATKSA